MVSNVSLLEADIMCGKESRDLELDERDADRILGYLG